MEEAAGGEEEPSVVRGWDAGSGMKVVRVTMEIGCDAARHPASTGPGVFYRARPSRSPGWGRSPSMAWSSGPGQKIDPCAGPSGCMLIFTCRPIYLSFLSLYDY